MTELTGVKKIGFYIVLIALSTVFLMAGGSKLSGAEMHVESFTRYGLPIAFMYFIGVAEVAGAIGLWISRVSALAAMGLIIIMFGAVAMHVIFDPVTMAIPAIVFTILLSIIVKVMFPKFKINVGKQNNSENSLA